LRVCLYENSTRDELSFEADSFLCKAGQYSQFIARSENGTAIAFVEASIRTDYVNGATSSPVAYIEGLYVDTRFRNQGIARKLIEQIVNWALSNGIKELASDALIDNHIGHAVHRALGFTETERVVYFKKDIE